MRHLTPALPLIDTEDSVMQVRRFNGVHHTQQLECPL